MEDLKTFVVVLSIQAGEYEKHNTHLVRGDTEAAAEKSALENEVHGCFFDGSAEWEDEATVYDMHGEFAYQVYSTKEVPKEEVSVLRKYLNLVR